MGESVNAREELMKRGGDRLNAEIERLRAELDEAELKRIAAEGMNAPLRARIADLEGALAAATSVRKLLEGCIAIGVAHDSVGPMYDDEKGGGGE